MRHPQEVQLVRRVNGEFMPTIAQYTTRLELDELYLEGIDTRPYEHAYRTQLGRQMAELTETQP